MDANRAIILCAALLCLAADQPIMRPVGLTWSRNPEPDIAAYYVFWGNASRQYCCATNVGNRTNVTISAIDAGTNWFFAVKAINTAGLESDYSEEVQWTGSVVPSRPRNLLLRSGIEWAPTPDGPWTELLSTRLPVDISDTNRFYRPMIDLAWPPMP